MQPQTLHPIVRPSFFFNIMPGKKKQHVSRRHTLNSKHLNWMTQGRRRVFKSGPAEEAIEPAEGTRGGRAREGDYSPLVRGVWGPPPRKVLGASMCVFNGIFMCSGPDFSRFGHKDISCLVRNRMLDKIVFRQSHVCFFYLFSMSL